MHLIKTLDDFKLLSLSYNYMMKVLSHPVTPRSPVRVHGLQSQCEGGPRLSAVTVSTTDPSDTPDVTTVPSHRLLLCESVSVQRGGVGTKCLAVIVS